MERLPQEVILYHVLEYLMQGEVVRGLSETNKYLCGLIRSRHRVVVDARPFEIQPGRGWREVEGLRCWPTEWGKVRMGCEEFVAGIEKDDAGCFTLKSLDQRLRGLPPSNFCLVSQYDFTYFQTLAIRTLELNSIKMESSDLLVIQSITALESLSFYECFIGCDLDAFPPNLKSLQVSNSSNWSGNVQFGNLPKSLKSIDIAKLFMPQACEARCLFPPGLLHLNILRLDQEAGVLSDRLPFDFPSSLKTLRMSSMYNIDALPSLEGLHQLESLELHNQYDLRIIPPLSQSLKRLVLGDCSSIQTVFLPPNLLELNCLKCESLEINLISLPRQLTSLKLAMCHKMREAKEISLPLHLEELYLDGFYNLEALPDLPQGLKSMTLMRCEKIKTLPMLPKSLRQLDLEDLINLDHMPFFPENLDSLSLRNCWRLIFTGPVASHMKSLTLGSLGFQCWTVSSLPDSIIELTIKGSSQINLNLSQFPRCLERLDLQDSSGIEFLPPFPETLKFLKLSCLKNLKSLPPLPGSLEELVLHHCSSIHEFSRLPPKLKVLKIWGFEQIHFVGVENEFSNKTAGLGGNFPNSLRTIEIRDCKGLQRVGKLPSNLKTLELDEMKQTLLFSLPMPARLESFCI